MSIRSKLILMLAIPLAALALVGAIGFRSQAQGAQQATEALEDDAIVQTLNRAIKAIGTERIGLIDPPPTEELEVIRANTNLAVSNVGAAAAEAGLFPIVEEVLRVTSNRIDLARSPGARLTQIAQLNDATAALRDLRSAVRVTYPDQVSFAEATSINLAVDIADRQDSIWLLYVVRDVVNPDFVEILRLESTATELLREQLLGAAPSEYVLPLSQSVQRDRGATGVAQLSRDAIEQSNLSLRTPLDDVSTLETLLESHNDWYDHAEDLQGEITDALETRSETAESRQNLFALLGTIGLLVLFALIYVVYRSVVRPLEELLVGAERVATNSLPSVVAELRTMGSSDAEIRLEPLPRESNDEVGSLVDAFNDVQLTAFDLAVEQARSRRNIAEMFVNLGRRNQKLLQRMLGVISDLESDEKNADKLERLFELDHMTTRMRRNAESLLVVAGTTSPRQWAAPVAAPDVVRGALAEVQDYHRVDVLALANSPMAGNAVADVTHMLAELIENALQFSDPGSRVSVSSRWWNGSYRIVISDQGFGMTPEELADNNRLIANPPAPDEAPTRFLGLFVVGHLSQRHGIEVLLTDAANGGTDARVMIPSTIMSEATDTGVADSGLPVRGTDVELDLDAELAQLTAEEAQRDAERSTGGLPVRDGSGPGVLPATPKVQPDTSAPFTEVVAPVGDLPVRGATPSGEAMPATAEASIDFGQLPELTSLDIAPAAPVAEQMPVAPVVESMPPAPIVQPLPSAPAAPSDLPVRGQEPVAAPAAPAGLDALGLPQRTPRATLQDVPAAADPVANSAAPAADEDVSTTASSVGSMFSSFQAGVQRGERTSN